MVVLATSGLLTGCVATTWHVQSAPPSQVLQGTALTDVRLTTTHNREVQLKNPVMEGASIIGLSRQPAVGPPVPVGRQAIALSSVKSVAIKQRDPAGSALLTGLAVGGLVLLTYAALFAAACAGDCME